jgi:hypothetical protein
MFSVDEANQLIPQLCAVFQRLGELRDEISARANEIERLGYNPAVSSHRTIPPEIVERRRILEARADDFRAAVQRIEDLGGQLKDLDLGLVDFPAVIGGESVLLCWQYGEPAVMHYHALDEGFRSRRRIAGAAAPLQS